MLSPAVQIREFDLTAVIPSVATSIGAYAGDFPWGPVLDINTISDESQMADRFGKPTDENFKYFLTAASFLQYSNNLKLVRSLQDGANNASTLGGTLLIKNDLHYDSSSYDNNGYFAARYPGIIGNGLKISYCLASEADFESWAYNDLFNGPPQTSPFAVDKNVINDEMHLVVVDEYGLFSGIVGNVLERFEYMSLIGNAKNEDGASNYFADVIRSASRYIHFLDLDPNLSANNAGKTAEYVIENDANDAFYHASHIVESGSPAEFTEAVATYQFSGGLDGTASGNQEIFAAYDLFADAEIVDINLLIGGSPPDETLIDARAYANYLIAIARDRHDCIALVSPPLFGVNGSVDSSSPDGVIEFAEGLMSSSFGVIESGAVKVYDKYNDKYRWIGASGHTAGLCAYTDRVRDPWWSPAGLNRGQMTNIAKLAYNPSKTDRDELYKNRINPVVQFPGQGTVLFGDKTLLARPSAFDRINVRRLFNILEKAIATAAKYYLFEFNDSFTRAQFKNMVEPYLREVKGRRGIFDFKVVCDESNNTPEIIDSGQFVADIYIKPARSINYISLNFIAVRTGVVFEEIVGMKNEAVS
jgi:hypothetical protein